jgi:hypothetical protein
MASPATGSEDPAHRRILEDAAQLRQQTRHLRARHRVLLHAVREMMDQYFVRRATYLRGRARRATPGKVRA